MASSPPNKRARHEPPARIGGSDGATAIRSQTSRKARTIHFRYRPNNSSHRWGPEEAFRELVRRWREDIIRINDLRDDEFVVLPTESRKDGALQICYRVPKLGSEPKQFLGHIRYYGTDGEGFVEIVTGGLQLEFAETERTSRGSIEAKIPYESLETAILVFMMAPQNHKVRLRSRLIDWRFNFNRHGNLLATQQTIAQCELERIQEVMEDIQRTEGLSSEALPGADTQFIFGEPGKGQDEHGNPTVKSQVKEDDFRRWTKVALFLWDLDSGGKSTTTNGEIILDENFSGLLYHDGLLLDRQHASMSAKWPLKYCYNFPKKTKYIKEGFVISASDQARAIIAIWNKVLTVRPLLAAQLSNMLNNTSVYYGEAAGAEHYLDYDAAVLLRRHLLGSTSKRLWYYSIEEKAKDPDLGEIIARLGCEGRELTPLYWSIMRKYGLLNTAEHELRKRLQTGSTVPGSELMASHFTTEICRLSRACLKLCDPVADYNISFIRDSNPEAQFAIDHASQLAMVPDSWLSRDEVVKDLGIPLQWKNEDIIFHTVYTLISSLLDLIPKDYVRHPTFSKTAPQQTKTAMLSNIHYRLLAYNRASSQIRLHHLPADTTTFIMSGSALPDTGWARAGDVIEFQLHRESCTHNRMWTATDLGSRHSCLPPTKSSEGPSASDEAACDVPPTSTCQSVELVCPPDSTSYIFAIFEDLIVRRTYLGLAMNKSDPDSIVIALQACQLPEKFSAAQQRSLELDNSRHLISALNCLAAEDGSSKDPPEDAGKDGTAHFLGLRTWARKGTPMAP